jgi:hypothetical protein
MKARTLISRRRRRPAQPGLSIGRGEESLILAELTLFESTHPLHASSPELLSLTPCFSGVQTNHRSFPTVSTVFPNTARFWSSPVLWRFRVLCKVPPQGPRPVHRTEKRQRTAALQDAGALSQALGMAPPLSRRDTPKITQRFNVGSKSNCDTSPAGTTKLRPNPTPLPTPRVISFESSLRDSALLATLDPTLKRGAIVECPFGTTGFMPGGYDAELNRSNRGNGEPPEANKANEERRARTACPNSGSTSLPLFSSVLFSHKSMPTGLFLLITHGCPIPSANFIKSENN